MGCGVSKSTLLQMQADYENQINSGKSRESQLQKEVQSSKSEVDALKSREEKLKKDLEAESTKEKALKAELAQLKAQLNALQDDEIILSLVQAKSTLERALGPTPVSEANLEQVKLSLSQKTGLQEELSGAKTLLQKALDDAQARTSKLTAELLEIKTRLQNTKDTTAAEEDKLTKEITTLKSDLVSITSAAEAKIKALTDSLNTAKADRLSAQQAGDAKERELSLQIDSAKAELEQTRRDVQQREADLASQLTKLKGNRSDLEKQLADTKAAGEAEIRQLETTITTLTAELAKCKADMAKTQQDLDGEVKQLTTQLANLKADLARLMEGNEAQAKVLALAKECDNNKTKLDEALAKDEGLRKQLEKLNFAVDDEFRVAPKPVAEGPATEPEFVKTLALAKDSQNDWSKVRKERLSWVERTQAAVDHLAQCARKPVPANIVNLALAGKLDGKYIMNDVPVITLFLSSTFTDTADERDVLIQDVYPFLKQFARSVGVEFYEPVEMRWGIRKESADAHLTSAICMNEITRCQKTSRGLRHILILGNKYGYRPFPTRIPKEEFEKLCAEMGKTSAGAEARDLAKKWYLLDENVIPAEYVLQPRSGVSDDEWWKIFEKLQLSFRNARNVLPKDRADMYTISVTHEETVRGIISKKDHPETYYVFYRDIDGIEQGAKDAAAKKFIDIQGSSIDKDAQVLLGDLRTSILPKFVPQDRCSKSTVKWHSAGITAPTHPDYMRKFADEFCELIFDNIVEVSSKTLYTMEEIYEESIAHIKFCNQKQEGLTLTAAISKVIATTVQYVKGEATGPLIIHGKSGAGKTCIMAACAAAVQKANPNANLIIRFLGTTAGSGSSRGLLGVLLPHIQRLYAAELSADEEGLGEVPGDYNQQIVWFRTVLKKIPATKPLILMLDSLDQLSDDDNGRRLAWLPLDAIPGTVKLIMSTLPDVGDCYNVLRATYPNNAQFLGVVPMDVADGETLLNGWLKKESRKLTDAQRTNILTGFSDNKSPLYLKIAYEASLEWKSYQEAERIGYSVRQLIFDLFSRLEHIHGQIFVTAALSYITVARSGLSNNEIQDILSCDDEVLDDVFEWWTPPIRRVPPLLWKRLGGDLERYVVQRGADGGIPVVQFYHRQFWEACEARYLTSTEERQFRNSSIADYFQGVWAEKPKPYNNNKLSADRQVPAQPIVLNGTIGQPGTVYNMRRLGEEVFNRMKADQYPELVATLSDINYIWAKCLTGQIYDLVREYATFEHIVSNRVRKITPVLQKVFDLGDWIQANAHILGSQPQIFIQQMMYEPSTSDIYNMGMELCKKYEQAMGVYGIWNNKLSYKNPTAMVITAHEGAVSCCALSPDGTRIATSSDDCTVRVFDAVTGQQYMKVKPSDNKASVVTWSPDSAHVYSGGQDAVFSVWNPKNGSLVSKIEAKGWVTALAASPRGDFVAVGRSFTFTLVSTATWKETITMEGHEKSVRGVQFSPDGEYLVSGGYDFRLCLWDASAASSGELTKLKPMLTFQEHTEGISGACISPNKKFMASAAADMFVYVYSIQDRKRVAAINNRIGKMYTCNFSSDSNYFICAGGGTKCVQIHSTKDWSRIVQLRGHSDVVWMVAFSPKNELIISCGGSLDKTVRVWDTKKALVSGEPTGHLSVCREVAWHPDGNRAVSCGDDFLAQLYDARTSKVLQTYKGATQKISSAQVSSDGKYVIGGGAEAKLFIWDAVTGELLDTIAGVHEKPILSIVFYEDLVWTTGNGFVGFFWRLISAPKGQKPTLERLARCEMLNAGFSSSFHPSGSCVLTRYDKGAIATWSSSTYKLTARYYVSDGESMNTISVACHPGGEIFAAGSNTGKVLVWKKFEGPEPATLEEVPLVQPHVVINAHNAKVKGVSFSPNGKYLATGSDDKTVGIFETETWTRLAIIPTQGANQTVAFSPDGRTVAAADFAGIVYFFDVKGIVVEEAPSRRQSFA